MRYIENEGVLFATNSPMNEFPQKIWDADEKKFVPYKGEVPKPQGWGEEISEQEAKEYMNDGADEAAAPQKGAM